VKITFIRPNIGRTRAADALEPLVFAILAGLTPPDIDLAFFDDRLEPIPLDDPTDLVALTVETYTARRAYHLAAPYRRRGIPVIMGGYHPTLLPAEAAQHADSIVLGDAEGLWPQIIADARRGRLQPVYGPTPFPSLAGLRLDRRIFRGKRYAPLGLVQSGRGCRFACDFCSIHAFYGPVTRQRPAEEVAAEIAALPQKLILLADDNIFANPAYAERLFRALIPLKIRWACQTSIDVAHNDALLKLMAQSGCALALIGFESLDERNLIQMKKRWNLKQTDYATAIKKFRDHGMMVCGTFVFGYDHDTPAAFDLTVEFALRQKFCLAHFNPLTPTPGAALYHRLQQEGRLIYNAWWLDPAFTYGQATFHPKGMTAAQLTEGCFRARQAFNAYGAMLSRAIDFKANCRTPFNLYAFAAANLVSRKEIYNKQGLPLGENRPAPAKREAAL
jgi:radical SAM superfamily enzyme YgiQ (UPF0313 family)